MKTKKPKPRLYKGFRDTFTTDVIARNDMIDKVRTVYERYGFSPLETPMVEYVEMLGKFLPESDQPDGGIFSFRSEDDEWLALRYDLTAPLSRVVAQYKELKRPYKRYQVGPVYRFEKPGPGRFREFYQFDFDTVGSSSISSDVEVCCIMCDTLEAVGIERGQYLIKVNNRKILNGVLETLNLNTLKKTISGKDPNGKSYKREVSWSDIFRSVDKLEKIGVNGVRDLLTKGRMDDSGAFTPGLELADSEVETIERYLNCKGKSRTETCDLLKDLVGESSIGNSGINDLLEIDKQLSNLGYNNDRVIFDPMIVRGLSYYTGPVFEGELTFEVKDKKGKSKSFGSVFGGGRYDDLVERFTGQKVPATGASIGVDRLLAALKHLGRIKEVTSTAKVLVTVMDKSYLQKYQLIAQELRQSGINVDLFTGNGNIGKQLKYADALNIPVVIIAGEDEFNSDQLQIKDLALGSKLSEEVLEREQWRKERPAQFAVKRGDIVDEISSLLRKINSD